MKSVSDIEVSEDSEAVLRIKLTFADNTTGDIVLSESAISIENCGEMSYNWGIPTEYATLTFVENCLKGSQRGFQYQMPIIGNVVKSGDRFILQPINGK